MKGKQKIDLGKQMDFLQLKKAYNGTLFALALVHRDNSNTLNLFRLLYFHNIDKDIKEPLSFLYVLQDLVKQTL
jgi:hypothetical protein